MTDHDAMLIPFQHGHGTLFSHPLIKDWSGDCQATTKHGRVENVVEQARTRHINKISIEQKINSADENSAESLKAFPQRDRNSIKLLEETVIGNEIDTEELLCDPSKPRPCQSTSTVCVWVPHANLHKCKPTTKDKTHSHPNFGFNLRKGSSPGRDVLNNNQGQQKPEEDHENFFPAHVVSSKDSVGGRQKRSFSRPYINSKKKESHISSRHHSRANVLSASAIVIPEYKGLMEWDDDSEQCIEKLEMSNELQSDKPTDEKISWLETSQHRICDFKKFFHCYLEDFLDQVDILDDPSQPGADPDVQPRAVCQCYESSMTIVNDMCYIPARFGTKSSCGDHITAPYPVKPWENAPILRPKCTPNSECRESQYFFGRRCECHHTAKFNRVTHTCDNATRLSFSALNVMLFILLLIFCH
ncbi:unnamed protein product [Orchesella dallaii]|uniref:Uncharacterized protein n=1 Tax=Orchesella dallaii TaxID=48710 RepID=A0ABP1QA15_9HEXA